MLALGRTVSVEAALSDLGTEEKRLTRALLRYLVVNGLVLLEQQHLLQKTIHTGTGRVRARLCSQ